MVNGSMVVEECDVWYEESMRIVEYSLTAEQDITPV